MRQCKTEPRLVRKLRSRGFPASKNRIVGLKEIDIRAKHKRRFKVTTDSKVKCKNIKFSNKQEKTRTLNEYAGFKWCLREESNLRPTRYECVALPTELLRHKTGRLYERLGVIANGMLRCRTAAVSLRSR